MVRKQCLRVAAPVQIAGETEVKALIKLRLRKADGSSLVVSRSFMLVQVLHHFACSCLCTQFSCLFCSLATPTPCVYLLHVPCTQSRSVCRFAHTVETSVGTLWLHAARQYSSWAAVHGSEAILRY